VLQIVHADGPMCPMWIDVLHGFATRKRILHETTVTMCSQIDAGRQSLSLCISHHKIHTSDVQTWTARTRSDVPTGNALPARFMSSDLNLIPGTFHLDPEIWNEAAEWCFMESLP
jgi:hypothetical protein